MRVTKGPQDHKIATQRLQKSPGGYSSFSHVKSNRSNDSEQRNQVDLASQKLQMKLKQVQTQIMMSLFSGDGSSKIDLNIADQVDATQREIEKSQAMDNKLPHVDEFTKQIKPGQSIIFNHGCSASFKFDGDSINNAKVDLCVNIPPDLAKQIEKDTKNKFAVEVIDADGKVIYSHFIKECQGGQNNIEADLDGAQSYKLSDKSRGYFQSCNVRIVDNSGPIGHKGEVEGIFEKDGMQYAVVMQKDYQNLPKEIVVPYSDIVGLIHNQQEITNKDVQKVSNEGKDNAVASAVGNSNLQYIGLRASTKDGTLIQIIGTKHEEDGTTKLIGLNDANDTMDYTLEDIVNFWDPRYNTSVAEKTEDRTSDLQIKFAQAVGSAGHQNLAINGLNGSDLIGKYIYTNGQRLEEKTENVEGEDVLWFKSDPLEIQWDKETVTSNFLTQPSKYPAQVCLYDKQGNIRKIVKCKVIESKARYDDDEEKYKKGESAIIINADLRTMEVNLSKQDFGNNIDLGDYFAVSSNTGCIVPTEDVIYSAQGLKFDGGKIYIQAKKLFDPEEVSIPMNVVTRVSDNV